MAESDYSGPMTETTYTLDEVHAALAHRLVEDMIQHEDDIARDEREPDVAPDTDYADMATDERNEALDDFWDEYHAWQADYDQRQQFAWSYYE